MVNMWGQEEIKCQLLPFKTDIHLLLIFFVQSYTRIIRRVKLKF